MVSIPNHSRFTNEHHFKPSDALSCVGLGRFKIEPRELGRPTVLRLRENTYLRATGARVQIIGQGLILQF